MTKKIFFTDLDGTLLDDDKKIGAKTFKALENFTNCGHILVLSSGRDINNLKNIKEKLKLDFPGLYLIGYNGGQIYDCGNDKTLFKKTMEKEEAVKIIRIANEMGIHCHTYSETHLLVPAGDQKAALYPKEFAYYRRSINTPVIYSHDLASDIKEGPCKCIAINLEDQAKLEKLKAKIQKSFPDITAIFSCPVYLELLPASSGKGAALKKLCEILNIPIADSIAAGDQENDLSMLLSAGFSIAMRNGAESLKDIADIVTENDNNHDGLADIFKAYPCTIK
ncbi:MAG: Cof-type HAD-IIB family hydrolase [Lachnospiraceae bacterium]|nr:Cof-type HAD-IIB family hydrolase [Lachnospiraceae bacterium]